MTGSFTPLIPNSRVAPDDGAYGALEGGSGGHVSIELREHEVVVPTASGPKTLLDKVTCSLLPGEVTAVLGPSGAGKTSLLNVLVANAAGSVAGKVLVNGQPVDRCAQWLFHAFSIRLVLHLWYQR